MHNTDFWSQCANAMELTIEGERLIVQEIADLMRGFGRKAADQLEAFPLSPRRSRSLPRV